MPRRRYIRLLLVVALLGLGAARASRAEDGAFEVIVNPANPVPAVERDFLRDAYLRKATDWDNGETIRPVDLSARFPERGRFMHEVLRKTYAQLRSYWSQRIFSGKGVPPVEADSTADVIAYVLAHPGAVGYLPAGSDPGHAKVISVH